MLIGIFLKFVKFVQVDNHYLPSHRRKDVTPFTVIGGRPNTAKPIALQWFVAHTNLVT